MINEPAIVRAAAFIDGQNLFHSAKEAFGYTFPSYDAIALAKRVCEMKGWTLVHTRFYTGIPDASDDARWNRFWAAKLAVMGRQTGVSVFSRPLKYRNQTVKLTGGSNYTFLVGQEKGIDVRLALDVVRLAREQLYDVAVVFSQDQDLSEAADEIKLIAREQKRWIKIACAYPSSPTSKNTRGINQTDWIKIDRATYDTCLDPRDYR